MEKFKDNEKVVVIDFGLDETLGEKIFQPTFAATISHTLLPFCYLFQAAAKQGIKFITPSMFFSCPEKPPVVLLISHLHGPMTTRLIASGARSTIFTCQESPFVAARFYVGLKTYARQFKYAVVFSGMASHLPKNIVYHQMFFPEPYTVQDFQPINFADKKLLSVVTSPKLIKNWLKIAAVKLAYGWRVKNIYKTRKKVIEYFAAQPDFDLYGRGWEATDLKNIWQGEAVDKFKVLKNYKFTLCFENAVFPGYITEKIFDAIFAGSVPIYYGAPDITDYIPREAFIDFRDFKNYEDLSVYIRQMKEEQYNSYLSAMRDFIQSKKYTKFSQEYFADKILKILNEEFVLCQK